MKLILENPVIEKKSQCDLFEGIKGVFFVEGQNIAECISSRNNSIFHLLCLTGKVKFSHNSEDYSINLKITEAENYGPLYVNKGKEGFFLYNNGSVRKLLDFIGASNTSELVGKVLKVCNNEKGFWIIDIS